MKYEKLTKLSIRNHPELSERWVQERIAEDPSILGLGDLILKDKERPQAGAGRLDLLLQDADSTRRYEVEIQLGKTDESHIIRTIEYWDIERKRYPQYEHTAVIIAEEITSRFLNVISLFNGTIPLMAIQMNAVQLGDTVSLAFTTVLDQVLFGLVDEDEETQEPADRAYWENRGSKATVAMADEVLALVQEFNPRLQLNYTKSYIGLAIDGRPNNFLLFFPKKDQIRIQPRMTKSTELEEAAEIAGVDVMDYRARYARYRLRLQKGEVQKQADILRKFLEASYREFGGGDASPSIPYSAPSPQWPVSVRPHLNALGPIPNDPPPRTDRHPRVAAAQPVCAAALQGYREPRRDDQRIRRHGPARRLLRPGPHDHEAGARRPFELRQLPPRQLR